ncbi:GxxExxY protein [Alterisphingorhabdus coralli]|uniref:GxxExxY protein n=1 Tax=Alterisphingorhabdus coralli TaxID=3071408 RepID=A0AA97F6E8_9SPHN|nr:GxxExxY protein [Parasphingorhabdus sp. SCSIO 66989]WOE75254.1 GxxExxY protein [Parasphingorhabdus sp. SCSIO 66989]
MHVEEVAAIAVDCGLQLHKDVGPGLLESAYQKMLAHLLTKRGLSVEEEIPIPITYDDLIIEQAFRADIVVERKLLIELKSVEKLLPVHRMQVVTYLRFMDLPVALLMNFSAERFKNGLVRIVNNHHDTKGSKLTLHQ